MCLLNIAGGGGVYPISITQYFCWSHVLSEGYSSDWSQVPYQGRVGVVPRQQGGYLSSRWVVPVPGRGYPSPRWVVPILGRGYPSPRQVKYPPPLPGSDLDRLCRGRYASCSFPQEDFLVAFSIWQGCGRD